MYNICDFNKLDDLGFTSEQGKKIYVKDEGCSKFCFLTQDYLTKELKVNLMFVDPYHFDI
jgi:hypothetical protein